MTDIPIIFSGPMVRALLEGRKSMTRRLAFRFSKDGLSKYATAWQAVVLGTKLWVRENLTHITSDPVTAQPCSVHCYTASIPPGMGSANPYEPNYLFHNDGEPNLKPKDISSRHMPRWASRLTLTVTATKIERLQMIRRSEIIAEGVESGIPVEFECLWEMLHGDGAWHQNPEVVALTFSVAHQNIDAASKAAA